MTKFTFRAAMLAVLALGATSNAAFAAAPTAPSGGHYEWRQVPQVGPHSPLTSPRRIWVSDPAQISDRDCAMMKANPADCMMDGAGKHRASSAG